MAIFPSYNADLENQINNITSATSSLKEIGRSFKFDWNEKQFQIKDGRVMETSKLQALKQWITLCLRTYPNEFNIYKDTDFGCNIKDCLGHKLDTYWRAQLESEIRKGLLKNAQIKSIDSINFTQEKMLITVNITLTLSNNELLNHSTTL